MKNIIIFISLFTFALFLTIGCTSDSRNMLGDTLAGKATDAAFDSLTAKSTEKQTTTKKTTSTDYVPSDADAHYIQPSDYFIAERDFPGQGYIWVKLARVLTEPSSKTKNEGQFMIVKSGKELWTKFFWKSRIASKSQIKIGMLLIAFDDNKIDDVYHAPQNKEDARTGDWFMAKITDTSDLYKGYVMVSGGYKVALDNIRILSR